MPHEIKEFLTNAGWGILRYGITCILGGWAIMKGSFDVMEAIKGEKLYHKLTTRRKVKCSLALSSLLFLLLIIYRSFAY